VGDQASICPPVDLLDAADEKADVVVFTHPHHDHASGMDRLVNEYTRGVVGCLPYYLHPDGKEPRWLIPRG
jgi:glyoxylase-like metal-dependent hydrolase (beta-lactamase superfamily II)